MPIAIATRAPAAPDPLTQDCTLYPESITGDLAPHLEDVVQELPVLDCTYTADCTFEQILV